MLTAAQHETLLDVATVAITTELLTGMRVAAAAEEYGAELAAPGASFVTLQRGDALLGCIGTITPLRPLVTDVSSNAAAAAFSDPRLPAITPDDYQVMSIELSLLSPLEPVTATSVEQLAATLRPGIDGVVLDAPGARATFLPAVWRHFGDDPVAFLAALWRKAGLAPGRWRRGTRCSRYTAEKVVDPGPRPAPAPA